jgi:hypothetical protein
MLWQIQAISVELLGWVGNWELGCLIFMIPKFLGPKDSRAGNQEEPELQY